MGIASNLDLLREIAEAAFNDSFMKPEIDTGGHYVAESPEGGSVVFPRRHFTVKDVAMELDIDEAEVEVVGGACSRLSAPGYLDSTEWDSHASEEDAIRHLLEQYGNEEAMEAIVSANPVLEAALNKPKPSENPVGEMAAALENLILGSPGAADEAIRALSGYRACLEKKPFPVAYVTGTDACKILEELDGNVVRSSDLAAMPAGERGQYSPIGNGLYLRGLDDGSMTVTQAEYDDDFRWAETTFATREEADAFAEWLCEGEGWLDATVVDPGSPLRDALAVFDKEGFPDGETE